MGRPISKRPETERERERESLHVLSFLLQFLFHHSLVNEPLDVFHSFTDRVVSIRRAYRAPLESQNPLGRSRLLWAQDAPRGFCDIGALAGAGRSWKPH